MTPIFSTWTYKDAKDAYAAMVQMTVGGEDGFKANLAFAEKGDHWQGGDTWPVAASLLGVFRSKMLAAVEPQFRPVDVISEVLDNVANGLLDREADVSFVPLKPAPEDNATEVAAQQNEIDAMTALIFSWWDRRGFWELVRKAVRRSRWATRGALRLWFTSKTLIETRANDGTVSTSIPTNLSFDKALDAIRILAPAPDEGFIYTDPDTQDECGVFFFTRGKDAALTKHVELWFIDGEQTKLRILQESSDTTQEAAIKTGGRLPMAQMVADLLITESVRRQQKSLNFIETVLVRVIEAAGFPERYTTNAMPSGMWLETKPLDRPPLDTRTVDGKTWFLHEVPRALGPFITTDLRGIPLENKDTGQKTLSTPGVTRFEPTDPEYLTKASDHGRKTMLRECKQGHLASVSTAESSGLAYIQARAIFGKDLKATKAPLEGMVRDVITAAIALAEYMSGKSGADSFLKKYRIVVNLHVDTGPPVPLEQAEFRAQYKDGLLSRPSAMTNCGVEDTDAESDELATDPLYLATLAKAQGDALDALQKGGASLLGAALRIGLTADDVTQLQVTDLSKVTQQ